MLAEFPLAHQVTYRYYMAVFAFLREDYTEAEKGFRDALALCHHRMKRNIECVTSRHCPSCLTRLLARALAPYY